MRTLTKRCKTASRWLRENDAPWPERPINPRAVAEDPCRVLRSTVILLHRGPAVGQGQRDPHAASGCSRIGLLRRPAAPLLGPTGAAAVFGPQKGANTADVHLLDDALARFALVL
ncbi:MAG: glycerate kinase, partial [Demequina sp.]|nr:glycerate kinase [Demequina sp.]